MPRMAELMAEQAAVDGNDEVLAASQLMLAKLMEEREAQDRRGG